MRLHRNGLLLRTLQLHLSHADSPQTTNKVLWLTACGWTPQPPILLYCCHAVLPQPCPLYLGRIDHETVSHRSQIALIARAWPVRWHCSWPQRYARFMQRLEVIILQLGAGCIFYFVRLLCYSMHERLDWNDSYGLRLHVCSCHDISFL